MNSVDLMESKLNRLDEEQWRNLEKCVKGGMNVLSMKKHVSTRNIRGVDFIVVATARESG